MLNRTTLSDQPSSHSRSKFVLLRGIESMAFAGVRLKAHVANNLNTSTIVVYQLKISQLASTRRNRRTLQPQTLSQILLAYGNYIIAGRGLRPEKPGGDPLLKFMTGVAC